MQLMNWGESSANGAWVKFWITPEDLEAFRHLKCKSGKIAGHRVAAVLVEIGDDEKPVQRDTTAKGSNAATVDDHGKHYAVLYKSGWFHNPKVWGSFDLRPELAPDIRISTIKQAIYDIFDVESLSDISPESFIQWCNEIGIRATLPAAFGGAA
ncbi:hypothetical protein BOC42_00415 [Burkholderia pseudomallei]|nr:hypothetical protein BOC42_00415 [Burkholderia pseudomallei]